MAFVIPEAPMLRGNLRPSQLEIEILNVAELILQNEVMGIETKKPLISQWFL